MYKVISCGMLGTLFCESFESLTINDKNCIVLKNVKQKYIVNKGKVITKGKGWYKPSKYVFHKQDYCIPCTQLIIESSIINGFQKYSEEQLYGNDPAINCHWMKYTYEDAKKIVEDKLNQY